MSTKYIPNTTAERIQRIRKYNGCTEAHVFRLAVAALEERIKADGVYVDLTLPPDWNGNGDSLAKATG